MKRKKRLEKKTGSARTRMLSAVLHIIYYTAASPDPALGQKAIQRTQSNQKGGSHNSGLKFFRRQVLPTIIQVGLVPCYSVCLFLGLLKFFSRSVPTPAPPSFSCGRLASGLRGAATSFSTDSTTAPPETRGFLQRTSYDCSRDKEKGSKT